MRGARTEEIAGRVANLAQEQPDAIFVDGTGGYGGGVVDALRLAHWQPIEVNSSAKANDQRYANLRAEMWWKMAEWIKAGGALPPLPELVDELTSPTYFITNGKLQLESKDQIKKRLGKSPDIADALALTFAQPFTHRAGSLFSVQSVADSYTDTEYNPYEGL